MIADSELRELMTDLSSLYEGESGYCYKKWNAISAPTEAELEREIFLSGNKYLNDYSILLKSIDIILKQYQTLK